jgi:N-methylhydantoinase A
MVLASTESERPARLQPVGRSSTPPALGKRAIFDARLGRREVVPVFERSRLRAGVSISGPALILEEGTSTYVSASFDVAVDAGDALILTAH